jgi:hypothetical protein
MAFILVFGVAYTSYQKYNSESSSMSESESKPEINLDGKVSITLLPSELTVNLMEAPISTITFFEVDYTKAAEYLRTRVAEIVHRKSVARGIASQRPQNQGNSPLVRSFK